jgi:diadenosine tetraphosphate (Ap4A) HIT family hydrolase
MMKNRPEEFVLESDNFTVHKSNFPVSPGHSEILPKNHIESFFDLSDGEVIELYNLIKEAKSQLDEKFKPDAYNIGVNDGRAAGRTIDHLHIHLIPRYEGDTPNPRGGIRNIFPDKADYTK